MAGKEKASQKAKLTGNLICQIKCNLSFSLDLPFLLPPFSLSVSLFAKSFIIVIYLQLKMPNIYLILSILQFICLPNRSSNKNLPLAPLFYPLPPPWLSDIRQGVSIAISRENFQFSTRAVRLKERERREREREKRKSEPNKLAWRIQNQSLRLELLAGLLVSSQISTKIWLSIIDGGNNGNVECSSLLAA